MDPVAGSNALPSLSSSSSSSPASSSSSSLSSSVIPPYPLTDTLAILCIFAIFPSWLSVLLNILYICLGSSRVVGSTLSLVFKHTLNGLHTQDASIRSYNFLAAYGFDSPTSKSYRSPIFSAISWLSIDFVLTICLLVLRPEVLDYTHLLAKAFIASNLASTKNRYMLNAILSTFLMLIIEAIAKLAIESFSMIINESGNAFSIYDLTPDLLYSTYYRYPKNPLKLLLYHLTHTNVNGTSRFVFGFEHLIEFSYSALSIYIIMHNLNPLLQKLVIYNNISKSLDNLTSVSIPSRLNISGNGKQTTTTTTSTTTSTTTATASSLLSSPSNLKTESTFQVVNPSSSEEIRVITISPEISKSKLPTILHYDGESTPSSSSDTDFDSQTSASESSTPASFPMGHQILNMNDISSTTLVVAQNFENYCLVALFPSFNFSNTALNPINSNTISSSTGTNSSNSTTTLTSKSKITPYLEKKMKYMGNKAHQPIWAFVSAAKTMFGSQDLYSGEYYQNNALVTTGRHNDYYTRSFTDSAQCFIWYTGETTIACELRNVMVDQLLVKVNGIPWDQTSPRGLYGRELVVISGLSPLSQYDIDFINVNEKMEHELLATTTVSTIHKNRILTESKPSTPLATLQESVATTQAAIDREKLKLKKLKTDWRKKSSALKTEIENLNNRTNFSDETRNYKKVESLRQAVAKSESELTNLSRKSEELYSRQTELDERYLDEKRVFESELRALTAFENQYNEKMNKELTKIKALNTEKSLLLQKQEKILNKKAKILNDISKLKDDIEEFKTSEIKFREDRRKIRSDQRSEKYKILINDINKWDKQLKNEYLKAQ